MTGGVSALGSHPQRGVHPVPSCQAQGGPGELTQALLIQQLLNSKYWIVEWRLSRPSPQDPGLPRRTYTGSPHPAAPELKILDC
jgi:hypothetical protein